MKTDRQIQIDVQDQLRWDPKTRDAEIGVAVKDGVVTLSGQVSAYAKRWAAVRSAEKVAGVIAVADDLTVRLPMDMEQTDTDFAHQVADALRWDAEVPTENVKATVANGWVTLEGTVEWQFERAAAERAVRYHSAVRGITNLISVKPARVSTFEVSHKIQEALRRTAEADADRIIVETSDGQVKLRGRVRSWAERQDAERAAWSAPGVREVKDEIQIGL